MNSKGGKKQKMRKLLKSKKALSPVVAAIILIAVTVAVSIAVAAWMGSLTIGFMETTELTVTDVTFTPGTNTTGVILLSVVNSGTSDATVTQARVNGDSIILSTPVSIAAGDPGSISLTHAVTAGSKYAISLFANDGTMIGSYTDTA